GWVEPPPELLGRHLGARDADDAEPRGQALTARQLVQRRQQLAACQVAGRAEDDEGGRLRGRLDAQTVQQRVGGAAPGSGHSPTISRAQGRRANGARVLEGAKGAGTFSTLSTTQHRHGLSVRYLIAFGVASILSCWRARAFRSGSFSVWAILINSSSSFTVKSAESTAGRDTFGV